MVELREVLVELWGAAALGVVVGWILPAVRPRGIRPFLASLAMAGIVGLWLAIQWGTDEAIVALVGIVVAWFVHAAWLDSLAKRSRPSQQPGG